MSELEAELEQLSSALEEKGAGLRYIIKEEKRRKEAELQVKTLIIIRNYSFVLIVTPFKCIILNVFQKQMSEGKFALRSGEELLEFANQTLTITNEEEFLKVGWEDIKNNKIN